MKKLSAALVALLPLVYVAAMWSSIKIRISDEQFFGILGVYALIGFLFPVIFSISSAKSARKFKAISNVWFYAGNLILLIAEIVYWFIQYEEVLIAERNGGMEGGLGLALLIIIYLPHWFTYLFTRIAGAISCARTLNGVCGGDAKIFHILLQLFPIFDLISAIWVLYKVNSLLAHSAKNSATI